MAVVGLRFWFDVSLNWIHIPCPLMSWLFWFSLLFLSDWQSPLGESADLKKLQIETSSIKPLLALRATYVMQLMINIAGSSSENLRPLFQSFESSQALVNRLVDLDSCLLSLEAMNSGWCLALAEILRTGSFDLRSALKGSGAKAATSLACKLLGESTALTVAQPKEIDVLVEG